MKKIDFGQAITILANVGVIAGIVFLAFELRQNAELSKAPTQTEITNARLQLTQGDISGPIVEILVRANDNQPLSPEDEIRLAMWMDGWVRHYENVYYQNLQGLYDKDGFEANMREMEIWFRDESGANVASHFCRSREMLSASFVAVIEDMLAQPCS